MSEQEQSTGIEDALTRVGFVRSFVENNRFTSESIRHFEQRLFFQGAGRQAELERYTLLLLLSAAIATYGVLGDSSATVIGAMIIAPLMRPIMATAAGLVMGDPERAGFSFLLVLTSVATVIGLAWLLAKLLVAPVVSFQTNAEITGRISPTLIDLFAALAAGAAGAFAMSRDDIVDSLPGVAIAISLAPPLCVAGIGLAVGDLDAALGAMILFMTNFLAILLAGGGILVLLGLSARTTSSLEKGARRRVFGLIAIGALLVIIPLSASSMQIVEESLVRQETRNLANEWLAETEFEVETISLVGDRIELVISGSGGRPPLSDLGDQLSTSLDRTIDLELVVVPSEREAFQTGEE
jgi:uncharacterized hydrophobic protein (TIGR00271 family)